MLPVTIAPSVPTAPWAESAPIPLKGPFEVGASPTYDELFTQQYPPPAVRDTATAHALQREPRATNGGTGRKRMDALPGPRVEAAALRQTQCEFVFPARRQR